MRLEKISDSFISAYMSKDDLTNLGLTADDAASAADIIIGAALSEFGFSYRRNECEITAEPGVTVTVRAKKRHTQSKTAILCFGDGKALYDACVFLQDKSIISSRLLCEGDGADKTYYLIIDYRAEGDPLWLSSVSELAEHSYHEKNAFFCYIIEHSCTVIEKNALNVIANSDKTW